ncbi:MULTISPECIES: ISAs1 family transposase [Methylococcus]|uniref:ISAs1 family transposase n=1 Tax=Methylococcus capsulatus TaxID=414 RepID=A0ABZ2F7I0_METCP|nr:MULTISPECIES: ISAs1 family transposase [Methylococcus]
MNPAYGCRWRRTPVYRSIRYALQGLDVQALAPQFRAHAARLAEGAAVIALDGKTLRGSLDRFEDRKAARVLSAFATEERIVLGQILIEDAGKDHEIQAAQRLIETLGLSGRLYTLDALHLQKTVETVLATGNDLLVQLKGNHPKRLAAVRTLCQSRAHAEQHYTVDQGRRNRIEQRTLRLWPLPRAAAPNPGTTTSRP